MMLVLNTVFLIINYWWVLDSVGAWYLDQFICVNVINAGELYKSISVFCIFDNFDTAINLRYIIVLDWKVLSFKKVEMEILR